MYKQLTLILYYPHSCTLWGSQSWLQPPFEAALCSCENFPPSNNNTSDEALRKTATPLGRRRSTLFVTFRLHDSLPSNRVFPPEVMTNGKAFVAMDRIL